MNENRFKNGLEAKALHRKQDKENRRIACIGRVRCGGEGEMGDDALLTAEKRMDHPCSA